MGGSASSFEDKLSGWIRRMSLSDRCRDSCLVEPVSNRLRDPAIFQSDPRIRVRLFAARWRHEDRFSLFWDTGRFFLFFPRLKLLFQASLVFLCCFNVKFIIKIRRGRKIDKNLFFFVIINGFYNYFLIVFIIILFCKIGNPDFMKNLKE